MRFCAIGKVLPSSLSGRGAASQVLDHLEMVNLLPFPDDYLAYLRDYAKTACGDGMEVHRDLCLPHSVLNDFEPTTDILFPSHDASDHAGTMAAATWGHLDVGYGPSQNESGSSQGACGTQGCDGQGEAESGGGGCGDLGKPKGDGSGGNTASKGT